MMNTAKRTTAYQILILCLGMVLAGCASLEHIAAPRIEDYLPERTSRTQSLEKDEGSFLPSSSVSPTLTLKTCVEIALDRNPLQAAAEAGLVAAGESVGEARAPYYPQLALQSGYHRWERHAYLSPSSIAWSRQAIRFTRKSLWFERLSSPKTSAYRCFNSDAVIRRILRTS